MRTASRRRRSPGTAARLNVLRNLPAPLRLLLGGVALLLLTDASLVLVLLVTPLPRCLRVGRRRPRRLNRPRRDGRVDVLLPLLLLLLLLARHALHPLLLLLLLLRLRR